LWSANGQATDEALVAITWNYTRLDFPDLHWPPYPTRLYGGRDSVIETDADTWIWISGRGEDSFRSAAELMVSNGVELEQISR
jgi:hypothetical protein